jgi:hypothetical protein
MNLVPIGLPRGLKGTMLEEQMAGIVVEEARGGQVVIGEG